MENDEVTGKKAKTTRGRKIKTKNQQAWPNRKVKGSSTLIEIISP